MRHLFFFGSLFLSINCFSQIQRELVKEKLSSVVYPELNFENGEILWDDFDFEKEGSANNFDMFGNRIPDVLLNYPNENPQSNAKQQNNLHLKSGSITAGHFILHFAEVDGSGNPLVNPFLDAQYGQQRTNVLKTVLEDLSVMLEEPPVNNCTGEKSYVNILVNSVSEFKDNVLGNATSNYNLDIPSKTILDGEVYKVLNFGVNNINFDQIHGFVNINFDNQFYLETENPNQNLMGVSEFDLYTVLLHEFFHCLGFNTLLNAGGESVYSIYNQFFYSRLDLLLNIEGDRTIISETPSFNIFDLKSFYDNGFSPSGCQNSLFETRDCNFLHNPINVYNPQNAFESGSSLSHIDNCGNGEQSLMHSSLLPRTFYRKPTFSEREILAEIGYELNSVYGKDPAQDVSYQNFGSSIGSSSEGGQNYSFDCQGKFNYIIRNCEVTNLVIELGGNINLDENYIICPNCPENSFTIQGNSILYENKVTDDFNGFINFHFFPKDGCSFGGFSEVHIRHNSCTSTTCFEGNGCVVNCNREMEPDISGDCREQLEFRFGETNVPFWENVDMGGLSSPDIFNIDGNFNFGILGDEAILHKVKMLKTNPYIVSFDLRSGGREDECNPEYQGHYTLEFVRIIGLKGQFPYFYKHRPLFDEIMERLTSSGTEFEVLGDFELAPIHTWEHFQLCVSPGFDFDNLLIFWKRSDGYDYLKVKDFRISKIENNLFQDEQILCGQSFIGDVDLSCYSDFEINLNWDNAIGETVFEGNDFITDVEGQYELSGSLNGKTCWNDEFSISKVGSDFSLELEKVECSSFDVSLVSVENIPNENIIWSNGNTGLVSNFASGSTGFVDVIINGCSYKREFETPEIVDVELTIATPNGSNVICGDEEIRMYELAGISVDWYNENDELIKSNSNELIINQPGIYRIKETPGAPETICYFGDEIQITKETFEIGDSFFFCMEEDAVVQGVITGEVGTVLYIWDGELGYSEDKKTYEFSEGGMYFQEISVTTNNCQFQETFTIEIHDPKIFEETIYLCPNEPFYITAEVSPAYDAMVNEITWEDGSFGDVYWNNIGLGEGTYSVGIEFESEGCVVFDEYTIHVSEVNNNVIFEPQYCSNPIIIPGSAPEGGSGDYSIQWQKMGFQNFSLLPPNPAIWEDIPGSVEQNLIVDGTLIVNSLQCYRRIVIDVNGCSETFSNEICFHPLNSQQENVWPESGRGSNNSMGHDIEMDLNGNVFVTGSFSGEIQLGRTGNEVVLNSVGGENYFIAKYDQCGEIQWAGVMETKVKIQVELFENSLIESGNNIFVSCPLDAAEELNFRVYNVDGDLIFSSNFVFPEPSNGALLKISKNGGAVMDKVKDIGFYKDYPMDISLNKDLNEMDVLYRTTGNTGAFSEPERHVVSYNLNDLKESKKIFAFKSYHSKHEDVLSLSSGNNVVTTGPFPNNFILQDGTNLKGALQFKGYNSMSDPKWLIAVIDRDGNEPEYHQTMSWSQTMEIGVSTFTHYGNLEVYEYPRDLYYYKNGQNGWKVGVVIFGLDGEVDHVSNLPLGFEPAIDFKISEIQIINNKVVFGYSNSGSHNLLVMEWNGSSLSFLFNYALESAGNLNGIGGTMNSICFTGDYGQTVNYDGSPYSPSQGSNLWATRLEIVDGDINEKKAKNDFKLKNADDFEIFPNPANDFVHFYSKDLPFKEIQIIDGLGRVIYLKEMNQYTGAINLEHFVPGIYLVKGSKINGNSSWQRLIVE